MAFTAFTVAIPARAQLRDARVGALRRSASPRRVASRSASVTVRASKLSLIATGTNLPHPDKVKKGGEDAFFVRIGKKGGGEMYLADGVGGFNEQGVDPGLYARVLTYEAAKAKDAMSKNPLARGEPIKLIQAAQEATKLPGASTMVVIECDGTKIKAANLGDSGFEWCATARLSSPPLLRSTISTAPSSSATSLFLKIRTPPRMLRRSSSPLSPATSWWRAVTVSSTTSSTTKLPRCPRRQ